MPRFICFLILTGLAQSHSGKSAGQPPKRRPMLPRRSTSTSPRSSSSIVPTAIIRAKLRRFHCSAMRCKKRAEQIEVVTHDRFMPPWKSVEGHGQFMGERRLKQEEIDLIARWVKKARWKATPATCRRRRRFPKVGSSASRISSSRCRSRTPFNADGPDDFRNFVFELAVPEGKYIKAAEFHPSNRVIVHHAALMIDTSGEARKKDEADPGPGFQGAALPGPLLPGSLATWTPGRDPSPLPEGFSLPWKPGTGLILQLHLHPSGKPESEQSSIGFYLTDEPPRRSMVDMLLMNTRSTSRREKRPIVRAMNSRFRIDMEALGHFPAHAPDRPRHQDHRPAAG